MWKSTDYGRIRTPIFDDQPSGSIGSIAVAPSNPDVICVGSGEGLQRPDLSTGDGIFRSTDGGKTRTHITNGIPDGAPVNVVREDPKRKGMRFSGTEREVYVSFDDGERWQSLMLNMPATSMCDLIVKDDDVVVATHGRGSGSSTTSRRCAGSTRQSPRHP